MSWSLSQWGTYDKCPARYKYRYMEKRPEPRGAAASRGVDNHAIVEGFINKVLPVLPDTLSFYTGFLTHLRDNGGQAEVKLALDRNWEPVPWDQGWWRGILDSLILPKPEEAILYDWKTGKIYPDHDDQKSLYSLAVFSTFPAVRSVRALHVYLDLGKNTHRDYSRDQMLMLRSVWQDRIAKLERDTQFIPHPGWYCTRCPFSRTQGGPCKF